MPREAWGYAVLLVTLCAIASIAVWQIISYLHAIVPSEHFRILAAVLWALTLGFMLIAGAFGLWATQFSAEAESRRRLSLLIDHMDYLADGLLAVDGRGRVTGANPAARALAPAPAATLPPLDRLFPCLTSGDMADLVNPPAPTEIERTRDHAGSPQVLRFRSQAAKGLTTIVVSDVTSTNEQRTRRRQAALLELVGQIAQGVAHDFNNLLCGISGHAALCARLPADSPALAPSLNAIETSAARGVALAGHLLQIAATAPVDTGLPVETHLRRAAEHIEGSLPEGWRVAARLLHLPPLALPGAQVETLVLNLGLLASETFTAPGSILIQSSPPGAREPFDVPPAYAGVLVLTASPSIDGPAAGAARDPRRRDPGAIQSVAGTLAAEVGGLLDAWDLTDGSRVFRLALPPGVPSSLPDRAAGIPEELGVYIRGWTILIGAPPQVGDLYAKRLNALGVRTPVARDIGALLANVEKQAHLDGLLVDESLLGDEPVGILRAITKLKPAAGIALLCREPATLTGELPEIVCLERRPPPGKAVMGLIEARSLAARRLPRTGRA